MTNETVRVYILKDEKDPVPTEFFQFYLDYNEVEAKCYVLRCLGIAETDQAFYSLCFLNPNDTLRYVYPDTTLRDSGVGDGALLIPKRIDAMYDSAQYQSIYSSNDYIQFYGDSVSVLPSSFDDQDTQDEDMLFNESQYITNINAEVGTVNYVYVPKTLVYHGSDKKNTRNIMVYYKQESQEMTLNCYDNLDPIIASIVNKFNLPSNINYVLLVCNNSKMEWYDDPNLKLEQKLGPSRESFLRIFPKEELIKFHIYLPYIKYKQSITLSIDITSTVDQIITKVCGLMNINSPMAYLLSASKNRSYFLDFDLPIPFQNCLEYSSLYLYRKCLNFSPNEVNNPRSSRLVYYTILNHIAPRAGQQLSLHEDEICRLILYQIIHNLDRPVTEKDVSSLIKGKADFGKIYPNDCEKYYDKLVNFLPYVSNFDRKDAIQALALLIRRRKFNLMLYKGVKLAECSYNVVTNMFSIEVFNDRMSEILERVNYLDIAKVNINAQKEVLVSFFKGDSVCQYSFRGQTMECLRDFYIDVRRNVESIRSALRVSRCNYDVSHRISLHCSKYPNTSTSDGREIVFDRRYNGAKVVSIIHNEFDLKDDPSNYICFLFDDKNPNFNMFWLREDDVILQYSVVSSFKCFILPRYYNFKILVDSSEKVLHNKDVTLTVKEILKILFEDLGEEYQNGYSLYDGDKPLMIEQAIPIQTFNLRGDEFVLSLKLHVFTINERISLLSRNILSVKRTINECLRYITGRECIFSTSHIIELVSYYTYLSSTLFNESEGLSKLCKNDIVSFLESKIKHPRHSKFKIEKDSVEEIKKKILANIEISNDSIAYAFKEIVTKFKDIIFFGSHEIKIKSLEMPGSIAESNKKVTLTAFLNEASVYVVNSNKYKECLENYHKHFSSNMKACEFGSHIEFYKEMMKRYQYILLSLRLEDVRSYSRSNNIVVLTTQLNDIETKYTLTFDAPEKAAEFYVSFDEFSGCKSMNNTLYHQKLNHENSVTTAKIMGTWVDESGRRFGKMVELYICYKSRSDNRWTTPRRWFPLSMKIHEVINESLELLGLRNDDDRYVGVISSRFGSHLLPSNAFLGDISVKQGSTLVIFERSEKIAFYTDPGKFKELHIDVTLPVIDIIKHLAKQFNIGCTSGYTLSTIKEVNGKEIPDTPLMFSKAIIEQFPNSARLFISRRFFVQTPYDKENINFQFETIKQYIRYSEVPDNKDLRKCIVYLAALEYFMNSKKVSEENIYPVTFTKEDIKSMKKVFDESYKEIKKTIKVGRVEDVYVEKAWSYENLLGTYTYTYHTGGGTSDSRGETDNKNIFQINPKGIICSQENIQFSRCYSMTSYRDCLLLSYLTDDPKSIYKYKMSAKEIRVSIETKNHLLAVYDSYVYVSRELSNILMLKHDSGSVQDEYQYRIPVSVYHNFNNNQVPVNLDTISYVQGSKLIGQVVSTLQLKQGDKYELLLRYSNGHSKWIIPEHSFGDLFPLKGMILNLFSEYITITVKYYEQTKDIRIRTSLPLSDTIKTICDAFGILFEAGFTLCYLSGETKVPLDLLETIPQQCFNSTVFYLWRRFKISNEYYLKFPLFNTSVYPSIRDYIFEESDSIKLDIADFKRTLLALYAISETPSGKSVGENILGKVRKYSDKMGVVPEKRDELLSFLGRRQKINSTNAKSLFVIYSHNVDHFGSEKFKFNIGVIHLGKNKMALGECIVYVSHNEFSVYPSNEFKRFTVSLSYVTMYFCMQQSLLIEFSLHNKEQTQVVFRGEGATAFKKILDQVLTCVNPRFERQSIEIEHRRALVRSLLNEVNKEPYHLNISGSLQSSNMYQFPFSRKFTLQQFCSLCLYYFLMSPKLINEYIIVLKDNDNQLLTYDVNDPTTLDNIHSDTFFIVKKVQEVTVTYSSGDSIRLNISIDTSGIDFIDACCKTFGINDSSCHTLYHIIDNGLIPVERDKKFISYGSSNYYLLRRYFILPKDFLLRQHQFYIPFFNDLFFSYVNSEFRVDTGGSLKLAIFALFSKSDNPSADKRRYLTDDSIGFLFQRNYTIDGPLVNGFRELLNTTPILDKITAIGLFISEIFHSYDIFTKEVYICRCRINDALYGKIVLSSFSLIVEGYSNILYFSSLISYKHYRDYIELIFDVDFQEVVVSIESDQNSLIFSYIDELKSIYRNEQFSYASKNSEQERIFKSSILYLFSANESMSMMLKGLTNLDSILEISSFEQRFQSIKSALDPNVHSYVDYVLECNIKPCIQSLLQSYNELSANAFDVRSRLSIQSNLYYLTRHIHLLCGKLQESGYNANLNDIYSLVGFTIDFCYSNISYEKLNAILTDIMNLITLLKKAGISHELEGVFIDSRSRLEKFIRDMSPLLTDLSENRCSSESLKQSMFNLRELSHIINNFSQIICEIYCDDMSSLIDLFGRCRMRISRTMKVDQLIGEDISKIEYIVLLYESRDFILYSINRLTHMMSNSISNNEIIGRIQEGRRIVNGLYNIIDSLCTRCQERPFDVGLLNSMHADISTCKGIIYNFNDVVRDVYLSSPDVSTYFMCTQLTRLFDLIYYYSDVTKREIQGCSVSYSSNDIIRILNNLSLNNPHFGSILQSESLSLVEINSSEDLIRVAHTITESNSYKMHISDKPVLNMFISSIRNFVENVSTRDSLIYFVRLYITDLFFTFEKILGTQLCERFSMWHYLSRLTLLSLSTSLSSAVYNSSDAFNNKESLIKIYISLLDMPSGLEYSEYKSIQDIFKFIRSKLNMIINVIRCIDDRITFEISTLDIPKLSQESDLDEMKGVLKQQISHIKTYLMNLINNCSSMEVRQKAQSLLSRLEQLSSMDIDEQSIHAFSKILTLITLDAKDLEQFINTNDLSKTLEIIKDSLKTVQYEFGSPQIQKETAIEFRNEILPLMNSVLSCLDSCLQQLDKADPFWNYYNQLRTELQKYINFIPVSKNKHLPQIWNDLYPMFCALYNSSPKSPELEDSVLNFIVHLEKYTDQPIKREPKTLSLLIKADLLDDNQYQTYIRDLINAFSNENNNNLSLIENVRTILDHLSLSSGTPMHTILYANANKVFIQSRSLLSIIESAKCIILSSANVSLKISYLLEVFYAVYNSMYAKIGRLIGQKDDILVHIKSNPRLFSAEFKYFVNELSNHLLNNEEYKNYVERSFSNFNSVYKAFLDIYLIFSNISRTSPQSKDFAGTLEIINSHLTSFFYSSSVCYSTLVFILYLCMDNIVHSLFVEFHRNPLSMPSDLSSCCKELIHILDDKYRFVYSDYNKTTSLLRAYDKLYKLVSAHNLSSVESIQVYDNYVKSIRTMLDVFYVFRSTFSSVEHFRGFCAGFSHISRVSLDLYTPYINQYTYMNICSFFIYQLLDVSHINKYSTSNGLNQVTYQNFDSLVSHVMNNLYSQDFSVIGQCIKNIVDAYTQIEENVLSLVQQKFLTRHEIVKDIEKADLLSNIRDKNILELMNEVISLFESSRDLANSFATENETYGLDLDRIMASTFTQRGSYLYILSDLCMTLVGIRVDIVKNTIQGVFNDVSSKVNGCLVSSRHAYSLIYSLFSSQAILSLLSLKFLQCSHNYSIITRLDSYKDITPQSISTALKEITSSSISSKSDNVILQQIILNYICDDIYQNIPGFLTEFLKSYTSNSTNPLIDFIYQISAQYYENSVQLQITTMKHVSSASRKMLIVSFAIQRLLTILFQVITKATDIFKYVKTQEGQYYLKSEFTVFKVTEIHNILVKIFSFYENVENLNALITSLSPENIIYLSRLINSILNIISSDMVYSLIVDPNIEPQLDSIIQYVVAQIKVDMSVTKFEDIISGSIITRSHERTLLLMYSHLSVQMILDIVHLYSILDNSVMNLVKMTDLSVNPIQCEIFKQIAPHIVANLRYPESDIAQHLMSEGQMQIVQYFIPSCIYLSAIILSVPFPNNNLIKFSDISGTLMRYITEKYAPTLCTDNYANLFLTGANGLLLTPIKASSYFTYSYHNYQSALIMCNSVYTIYSHKTNVDSIQIDSLLSRVSFERQVMTRDTLFQIDEICYRDEIHDFLEQMCQEDLCMCVSTVISQLYLSKANITLLHNTVRTSFDFSNTMEKALFLQLQNGTLISTCSYVSKIPNVQDLDNEMIASLKSLAISFLSYCIISLLYIRVKVRPELLSEENISRLPIYCKDLHTKLEHLFYSINEQHNLLALKRDDEVVRIVMNLSIEDLILQQVLLLNMSMLEKKNLHHLPKYVQPSIENISFDLMEEAVKLEKYGMAALETLQKQNINEVSFRMPTFSEIQKALKYSQENFERSLLHSKLSFVLHLFMKANLERLNENGNLKTSNNSKPCLSIEMLMIIQGEIRDIIATSLPKPNILTFYHSKKLEELVQHTLVINDLLNIVAPNEYVTVFTDLSTVDSFDNVSFSHIDTTPINLVKRSEVQSILSRSTVLRDLITVLSQAHSFSLDDVKRHLNVICKGILPLLSNMIKRDHSQVVIDNSVRKLLKVTPQLITFIALLRVDSKVQKYIRFRGIDVLRQILEIERTSLELNNNQSEIIFTKNVVYLYQELMYISSILDPNMDVDLIDVCTELVLSLKSLDAHCTIKSMIKFISYNISCLISGNFSDDVYKVSEWLEAKLVEVIDRFYIPNIALDREYAEGIKPTIINISGYQLSKSHRLIGEISDSKQVVQLVNLYMENLNKSSSELVYSFQKRNAAKVDESISNIIYSIANSQLCICRGFEILKEYDSSAFLHYLVLMSQTLQALTQFPNSSQAFDANNDSFKRVTRRIKRMTNSMMDMIEEEQSKINTTEFSKQLTSFARSICSSLQVILSILSLRAKSKVSEILQVVISKDVSRFSNIVTVIEENKKLILSLNKKEDIVHGFSEAYGRYMSSLHEYMKIISNTSLSLTESLSGVKSLSQSLKDLIESTLLLSDVVEAVPDVENAEKIPKGYSAPTVSPDSGDVRAAYNSLVAIINSDFNSSDPNRNVIELFYSSVGSLSNEKVIVVMDNMIGKVTRYLQLILNMSACTLSIQYQKTLTDAVFRIADIVNLILKDLRNKFLLRGNFEKAYMEKKSLLESLSASMAHSTRAFQDFEKEERDQATVVAKFKDVLDLLLAETNSIRGLKKTLERIDDTYTVELSSAFLEVFIQLSEALKKVLLDAKSHSTSYRNVDDAIKLIKSNVIGNLRAASDAYNHVLQSGGKDFIVFQKALVEISNVCNMFIDTIQPCRNDAVELCNAISKLCNESHNIARNVEEFHKALVAKQATLEDLEKQGAAAAHQPRYPKERLLQILALEADVLRFRKYKERAELRLKAVESSM